MEWCIAEIREHPVPGIYIATSAPAIVMASVDRENWTRIIEIPGSGTVGNVVEWPRVQVESGELRSIPEPGQLNLMWCHGEVLSFGDAFLEQTEPDRQYRLERVLRGLRGTRTAHDPLPGYQFMMLADAHFLPMAEILIGTTFHWKIVPHAGNPAEAPARPWKLQGLRSPRLDGSRPSVMAAVETLPEDPSWDSRYILLQQEGSQGPLEPGLWCWVDRWVQEPLEPGAVIWRRDISCQVLWDGDRWLQLNGAFSSGAF